MQADLQSTHVTTKNLGLSLTGGGARGAYQAGVIKGIAHIFKEFYAENRNLNKENFGQKLTSFPFSSFSGVSAGAINAAYLAAAEAEIDFTKTAEDLCQLWENIRAEEVYRTDFLSLGKNSLKWMRDVTFGGVFQKKLAGELLDNRPLEKFLEKHISLENLSKNIQSGQIQGLACTAFNYQQKKSQCFLQVQPHIHSWDRPKRQGIVTNLTHKHIFASCAIPIVFPPVLMDKAYYGDGSLRNTAPISPLIHMGANPIIFVGVRYKGEEVNLQTSQAKKPSVAEIFGTLLNGLFFDTTDIDIERLQSLNDIYDLYTHATHLRKVEELQKIDYVRIRPSVNISELAKEYAPQALPSMIDYLLKGLGNEEEYAELASYLLFDSRYTRKLVEIGYQDALHNKSEIQRCI